MVSAPIVDTASQISVLRFVAKKLIEKMNRNHTSSTSGLVQSMTAAMIMGKINLISLTVSSPGSNTISWSVSYRGSG